MHVVADPNYGATNTLHHRCGFVLPSSSHHHYPINKTKQYRIHTCCTNTPFLVKHTRECEHACVCVLPARRLPVSLLYFYFFRRKILFFIAIFVMCFRFASVSSLASFFPFNVIKRWPLLPTCVLVCVRAPVHVCLCRCCYCDFTSAISYTAKLVFLRFFARFQSTDFVSF